METERDNVWGVGSILLALIFGAMIFFMLLSFVPGHDVQVERGDCESREGCR